MARNYKSNTNNPSLTYYNRLTIDCFSLHCRSYELHNSILNSHLGHKCSQIYALTLLYALTLFYLAKCWQMYTLFYSTWPTSSTLITLQLHVAFIT